MTPSAAVWPRVSPLSRPVPWAPMAALIYTDPAATLRPRHAPVAQLDRASVYGTEGQRFESSRARFEGPADRWVFLFLGSDGEVSRPRRDPDSPSSAPALSPARGSLIKMRKGRP